MTRFILAIAIMIISAPVFAQSDSNGTIYRSHIVFYGDLTPAQCTLYAPRVDLVIEGRAEDFDLIRDLNPDMIFARYLSIIDANNGAKDYVKARTSDSEQVYIHFKDSTLIYWAGMWDTCVGLDAAITAADTVKSRIRVYSKASNRYLLNLFDSDIRLYTKQYVCSVMTALAYDPISGTADSAHYTGFFWDNAALRGTNVWSGVQDTGVFGGGGHVAELTSNPRIDSVIGYNIGVDQIWRDSALFLFFQEIKDTFALATSWHPDTTRWRDGASDSVLWSVPNIAHTWEDKLCENNLVNWLFAENDPPQFSNSGWAYDYSSCDTLACNLFRRDSIAYANGIIVGFSFPAQSDSVVYYYDGGVTYYSSEECTGECDSTAVYNTQHIPAVQLTSLAMHYMLTDHASFMMQSSIGANPADPHFDSTAWRKCFAQNFGSAVDAKYSLDTTGTDDRGYTFNVYTREYDSAYFYHRAFYSSAEPRDDTGSVTITLPEDCQELDIEGVRGSIVSTIDLDVGVGRVMMKLSGPTVSGSFIDTNYLSVAVRATYANYTGIDSIRFFIDTDGTIDGADSLIETTDLTSPTDTLFTGLSPNTAYDFWIVISSDKGQDTSSMFEVTTLLPSQTSFAAKPDTLEIFYQHSSLGDNWLSEPVVNSYSKKYIQCTLSVAEDWPINWYDYRSNSTNASATAGWRSDLIDCDASSPDSTLGVRPPLHWDCTEWNMSPVHIEAFWFQDYTNDTTTKARVLKDFNVVDTTADPDSTFRPTSNDIFWFETAYFQYDDLSSDEEVQVVKDYYQIMRDSALEYPDHFFILAAGSPLNYFANAGNNDSIDNWNAQWLDTWCRDTLVDTVNYPNFRYLSMYQALAEHSFDTVSIYHWFDGEDPGTYFWDTTDAICPSGDSALCDSIIAIQTYGCLKWAYAPPDVRNSHPGTIGNVVAQDTALAFLERLITGVLSTYWVAMSISGSLTDTNDVSVTLRADYSGYTNQDTIWFFVDDDGTIAGADSGGVTTDVASPTDTTMIGLTPNHAYDFWIVISDDDGRDTSAMFEVTTLNTVTHSLSVDDSTSSTFDIINNYVANSVDTIWLWFDTDTNMTGADSVVETTGINDPDTLQATGLSESTKYYYRWGLHDQLGRDTSVVDSVTTTIMPLTSDSFSISGVDNDCAKIYSFNAQYNYGAQQSFEVGTPFSTRRFHAPIRFLTLIDSMRNIGVATWDSAHLGIIIQSVSSLTAGSSIPDTLAISINKMTTIWDEGTHASGGATGGITWDSASAIGTGGVEENSPLDWTVDGGDFNATAESDSIILVGGIVSSVDTIILKIKGASIADTVTNYGYMIHYAYIADGDDGGTGCGVSFYSDDVITVEYKPYLTVYYTTGAEEAPGKKLRKGYFRRAKL